MNSGIDQDMIAGIEKASTKAKSYIEKGKKSLTTIITVVIYAAIVIAQCVLMYFRAGFDQGFWTNLVFSLALMLATRHLWLGEGRKKGAADKDFIANKKTAGESLGMVFANRELAEFDAFCKYANEVNLKDKLENILFSTGIDKAKYYADYQGLAINKIKCLSELRPFQRRVLIKLARRPLKVPKLYSTMFTSENDNNAVRFKREKTEKKSLVKISAMWTTMFLIISFGTAMITTATRTEIDVLSVIFQSLLWLITTVFSAVVGFNAGVKLITVDRSNYYLSVVHILTEFSEWKKTQSTIIEAAVVDKDKPINPAVRR